MTFLDSLSVYTTVVADTATSKPSLNTSLRTTTNPSLLFQASQKPQYQNFVDEALDPALNSPGDRTRCRAQRYS